MVVLKRMLPQSENGVFNAKSSFMLRAVIRGWKTRLAFEGLPTAVVRKDFA
jgi:hypothetical protein